MPNNFKKLLKSVSKPAPASPSRTSSGGMSLWPRYEEDRLRYVLCIILLVYVIFWVGTLIRNNLQKYNRIGWANLVAPTISVDGVGTVSATPDIATVQIGLLSAGKDIATVQQENTLKMNALIVEFKKLGIASEDLQTANFSVNPTYDYRNGRSDINGYHVQQLVTVKIRDLGKIGDVFARAGQYGANQVSGPTFTIDDEESLKSQARTLAIAEARKKLMALSRDLGVHPIRLIAFSESSTRPPIFYAYERAAVGIGGPEPTSPEIQPGQDEIQVQVSVTYEVR